ncbi:ChrR family anti-sigma-E factor [Blastochloris viridis]|uniref:ChrR family anti-sigma-E factor n=1 Tax=Blastochloris viridis TaxID=1079 RepID=UPI001EEE69E0|nr:ChrR family anti-sigma-E factor [Blastochloris viridis]
MDALLADYAAGSLQGPMSVLVEAHLELSPQNLSFVRDLDVLGGILLDDAPPMPLKDRDSRLAAILADDAPPPPVRRRPPEVADPVLPTAIRRFIGRPFSEVRWHSKLPGLKECRLDRDGTEVSLMWLRAGSAVPAHTHTGREAVLVLSGGFSDAYGRYDRGDLAVADEMTDHKPVADDDEDCICFIVQEGHLKLTGLLGRIFQRLIERR